MERGGGSNVDAWLVDCCVFACVCLAVPLRFCMMNRLSCSCCYSLFVFIDVLLIMIVGGRSSSSRSGFEERGEGTRLIVVCAFYIRLLVLCFSFYSSD